MKAENRGDSLTERLRLISLISLRRQGTINPPSYQDNIILEPNLKSQMSILISYFSQFKSKQLYTHKIGKCLSVSNDNSSVFYGTSRGKLLCCRFHKKEKLFAVTLKKAPITCISICKSTNKLLIGLASGEVFVHSQYGKDQQKLQFMAHQSGVTGICSGSSEFVTVGNDGKVLSWKNGHYSDPQLLYNHDKEILAVDLSLDERYLATGGKDRIVKIYDLDFSSILQEMAENRMGIVTCVKITAKNKFLAIGDDAGKISVYEINSLEKVHFFSKHCRSITSLATTDNEFYLISGGKDGKIFIWSLNSEKTNPIELEGHNGAIYSIQMLNNTQMFCSISNDLTLRTWGIPNFNHYVILELDLKFHSFSEVFVSSHKAKYFYLKQNEKVVRINRKSKKYEWFNLKDSLNVKAFAVDQFNNQICVVDSDEDDKHKKKPFNFSLFSLENFSLIKMWTRKCYGVHSMIFSFGGEFLIIGEANKCTILYSKTFKTFYKFVLHRNPIEYLAISKNKKFLVTARSESESIKLYKLLDKQLANIYRDYTFRKEKKILFSNDEEFFVVLSKENSLSVWTTAKKIMIFSLNAEDILDIHLHPNEYLYLIREKSIESLDFPSFTRSFLISFEETINFFTFSYDWSELIIILATKIEIWKSPLAVDTLTVYGNNSKLYSFCEYLGKAIAGEEDSHSHDFDSWIIEPFHMNISHIFAYLNKTDMLNLCIQKGSGFLNSKTNFSPMDICLEMNNEKGIQAFYKYLKDECRSHPCITNLLKSSVNKLLKHESSTAKEILDLILLKAMDTGYPGYTSEVLPIINFYETFLNTSMPENSNFSKKIGKKVEYLQSYFKLNLKMGSYDSLNFLRSLLSTRNEETYNSRFVQTILDYKWIRTKKILIIQAIFYVIYLILVSFFAVYDDKNLITAAFILNVILIIYEVIQMSVSFFDYVKDSWNLLDIVRFAAMTWVFVKVQSPGKQNNVTAFLIFISWMRGIAYFRIISFTRYYIRLIRHVIIDIIPFITIFFYSTIAFSLILFKLSETKHSYNYILSKSWEMNLTSFDGEDYSGYVYLAFSLYMMFNPIIMLTLLVSIMSHTFDRLHERVRVSEGYALCKMIIEVELFCFWKRNIKKKTYLHVCRSVDMEFESDNFLELIEDRVKNVQKEINSLGENLNQSIENLNYQMKVISKSIQKLSHEHTKVTITQEPTLED